MATHAPSVAASSAAATAPRITKLAAHDVNRICSGQVVSTLATAVKELVENAVDAGATQVEVKLREYGAEAIEVSDNGCGIPPADFELITRKSYTSKISAFADIYAVKSFGFRGEALASLCEVAGALSVITHARDQVIATRLEFDSGGRITSSAPAARPVGTTVLVSDLFKPLPVRRKDFLRSLRRQFARLHVVLQGYAMISTRVRLLVTNVVTGSSGGLVQLGLVSSGGGGGGRGGSRSGLGSSNRSNTAWASSAVKSSPSSSSASASAASSMPIPRRPSSSSSVDRNENKGGDDDIDADDADDAALDDVIPAGILSAPRGSRHTVLSTSGKGSSLRDHIGEVLSAKFLATLQAFETPLPEFDAMTGMAVSGTKKNTAPSAAGVVHTSSTSPAADAGLTLHEPTLFSTAPAAAAAASSLADDGTPLQSSLSSSTLLSASPSTDQVEVGGASPSTGQVEVGASPGSDGPASASSQLYGSPSVSYISPGTSSSRGSSSCGGDSGIRLSLSSAGGGDCTSELSPQLSPILVKTAPSVAPASAEAAAASSTHVSPSSSSSSSSSSASSATPHHSSSSAGVRDVANSNSSCSSSSSSSGGGGSFIHGFVSRAGTGVGRANNEKQFLYLNGRPVDIPRVTKTLNEV